MRVQPIKMKALQILAASALILAAAGPSTVRAEQRVIESGEVIQTTQTSRSEPVVIERHTTIVEGPDVDVNVGGGGIVSSTLDVTGEVLALPFKLVGGVINLAF